MQDVLCDAAYKVQLALFLGGAVKVFLNMLISDSLTTVDPVGSNRKFVYIGQYNVLMYLSYQFVRGTLDSTMYLCI